MGLGDKGAEIPHVGLKLIVALEVRRRGADRAIALVTSDQHELGHPSLRLGAIETGLGDPHLDDVFGR